MRVRPRRGMLRRVPLLSHVRLGVDTMGMVAPVYYTADMVRALPDDGNRYEVVHGELLVTPAPRLWHQKLVGRLYSALEGYLRDQPVGEAFTAPADISWGRHVLVQPDVFVVPRAEARSLDWTAIRSLLLAAEILSPSSQRADRFTKRRLYQERSVPTYLKERRATAPPPSPRSRGAPGRCRALLRRFQTIPLRDARRRPCHPRRGR